MAALPAQHVRRSISMILPPQAPVHSELPQLALRGGASLLVLPADFDFEDLAELFSTLDFVGLSAYIPMTHPWSGVRGEGRRPGWPGTAPLQALLEAGFRAALHAACFPGRSVLRLSPCRPRCQV